LVATQNLRLDHIQITTIFFWKLSDYQTQDLRMSRPIRCKFQIHYNNSLVWRATQSHFDYAQFLQNLQTRIANNPSLSTYSLLPEANLFDASMLFDLTVPARLINQLAVYNASLTDLMNNRSLNYKTFIATEKV